jgi:predicted dehydrogenase
VNPNGDVSGFNIDAFMPALEGALRHDKNLSQWLPKLVPKHVSEDDFWKNYFSHVQAIRVGANLPTIVPHSQTNGASNGTAHESSHSDFKSTVPSARTLDSAPSTAAAAAAASASAATTTTQPIHPHTDSMDDDKKHQVTTNGTASSNANTLALTDDESISEEYALESEAPLVYDESTLRPAIRWGIIGCGSVCEIKSGPAFRKVKGSRLVAVMRRTAELARDYAERHNVPKYYTTVEELIHDPEVDAVYVATPPGSHYEIAVQVCRVGKPCYVEKPMARNFEECRSMMEMFKRAELPLFVGYYRRRLSRFLAAKQIIQRFLGSVTSVYVILNRNDMISSRDMGWRVVPEQSGGGLFLDLGSHTLDTLDFLLGPLNTVTGDAFTHGSANLNTVETNCSMTFRTQTGSAGIATWDFCSAVYEDLLTINGTHGRLTMSIFGKDGPVLHLPNGKSIEYDHTYPDHVHLPLVTSIVQSLRGVDVPEERLSTGASACRTARVMDAVLRTFYRSRTDEFWKRPHTWASGHNATAYERRMMP